MTTLESVTTAFNHWRETRSSRKAAVPAVLREQAIELLSHYKPSQVITSLKINHSMLKRWRGDDHASINSKTSTFVPLGTDTASQPRVSGLEITWRNSLGSEMQVKGDLTLVQLTQLAHTFIRAEGVA